jgi:hypothetical protein
VLNEVRQLDRQLRIKEGLIKQISRNPALKQAYDVLVKDLPEDQREDVVAQLARQQRRAARRIEQRSQEATVKVGV